ncbi:hypothetical protein QNH23_16580 [Siminovitchia fortis]|uniref:Secreted protein n=1 Tax=Siminovitchia fortis TaxID=254758 RepID=A0A451GBW2_9BACI|nr:hypothetical protein [Siminovitchia fortis]RWR12584.1 hypothetical protein D4N35_006075 [Siminovitchia fortis]WHY81469.1 hypothetical protein QNH23_16580 [Siminovitchia fortis]
MKRNIWIWVVSAVVYLVIVIAGYSVYASVNAKADGQTNHADVEQEEENMDHQHSHHEHGNHGTNTASEVIPKVSYANGEITIELKDKNGHVPELEVSHEKHMHLIVVSTDLKEYYHVHPEKKAEGIYQLPIRLADQSYKVFVDIKPKGLQYSIKPIELHVGESHKQHQDNDLIVDTDFTKTINGQTVELTSTSLEVNKEVTFNFDVKDAQPEPYLGALGHVVILDEDGEQFIHVHPVSEDQTVFQTQFNKPGVYKLWAEFKFGERVNAYPFVIEVQ